MSFCISGAEKAAFETSSDPSENRYKLKSIKNPPLHQALLQDPSSKLG